MTQLELPKEGRARQLFMRLEGAFQGFLERLPPGLADLAGQQGTYLGDFNPGPFKGLDSLNPVLVCTPWLFWECFRGLDDEAFLQVAEAGTFYVLASVVLDHLVDGQSGTPGLLAVYHQALYNRGIDGYRATFPGASPFWEHYDRLAEEHLSGLAAEIAVQNRPGDFNAQTLAAIAHGKVAPIITTLAGLSIASGQPDVFIAVEASLKHIAVASQLLDDIGDWQADVQNHHLTYYLTLLAAPQVWMQADPPPIVILQQNLEAGWIDVIQLKQVMQGLNDSIEAVQGINCPAWVRYVDGYRALTDEHLERRILLDLGRALKKME